MLVRDNKYIPTEDKDFFILLRIGLWQKVEEELSLCPDWEYIYKLATEQTVQGIVADGIGLYRKEHPELNITQAENDKFLSASAQIVRRNYAINKLQSHICQLFAENNITYVVLKGQGVAQCYPKPNLRCSGDIDFLVPSENADDYDRARQLMFSITSETDPYNVRELHQCFTLGNLSAEIHGRALSNYTDRLDKAIEQERMQMFKTKDFNSYICNGQKVMLPSTKYHTLYQFCHILKHITYEGIGLRQFCDFTLFLHTHSKELQSYGIENFIRTNNLTREWSVLISFASHFLGLPIDSIPAYKRPKLYFCHIHLIWADCKNNGNFGHYKEKIYFLDTPSWLRNRISETLYDFKRDWLFSPKRAICVIVNTYRKSLAHKTRKLLKIGI